MAAGAARLAGLRGHLDGWVGLGGLTGFGTIHPLPGIADGVTLNTAITLPIGVETYAAYALNVWLGGHQLTRRARSFVKWSALGRARVGGAGGKWRST